MISYRLWEFLRYTVTMSVNAMDHTEEFFTKFTNLKFAKGTVIVNAEEEPEGVYYLKKGFVKQYTISSQGEPLVIHIFRPGSFFPLSWVLCDKVDAYIHEAATAVQLYRAPREAVESFLQAHPAVMDSLARRLMSGLLGMRKRLAATIAQDAFRRSAGIILYLAETIGERQNGQLVIPVALPHRELAAWIGTTRETASIQVEHLVKKGFISSRHGHIAVKNLSGLEKLLK